MSQRPSASGGGSEGSSRESQEFREYVSRESHYRPPPWEYGKQGNREPYSESSYAIHQGSGLPLVYRATAKPLYKDRDQFIHDFGRLRVAPESYRRKSADVNSAQPKRTQEMRSQEPGLPSTESSPSKSRPSQNYAEHRRPSYHSGKPEVSSNNTYREPLSLYSRKKMLDRSGTDSCQYNPQSSSRCEEKPRSSRSGRYDDVDDDCGNRYKKPYKAVWPSPIKEELPNHYATLGISPDASIAEITKAAKIQRIKVHPDKCENAAMSEVELKKVDERAAQVGYAAEVLLDPEQKADYDRDCHNARRRNARTGQSGPVVR